MIKRDGIEITYLSFDDSLGFEQDWKQNLVILAREVERNLKRGKVIMKMTGDLYSGPGKWTSGGLFCGLKPWNSSNSETHLSDFPLSGPRVYLHGDNLAGIP